MWNAGLWKLTSRSSFQGMSLSPDALLPLVACLFVGGARSSTLWPAALFLSSILVVDEGRGPTVDAAVVIRCRRLESQNGDGRKGEALVFDLDRAAQEARRRCQEDAWAVSVVLSSEVWDFDVRSRNLAS